MTCDVQLQPFSPRPGADRQIGRMQQLNMAPTGEDIIATRYAYLRDASLGAALITKPSHLCTASRDQPHY